MRRAKHHSFAVAGAVLGVWMVSCASHPEKPAVRSGYAASGAVSAEVVIQPSAERYLVAPGVSYSGPLPASDNPEPKYPASLLARLLDAVEVVVRVVVDSAGVVSNATVISSTSSETAFGNEVLAAVSGWKFEPLRRIADGKSEALPFTQEYRFVFRQVDGHAVVETPVAQKR